MEKYLSMVALIGLTSCASNSSLDIVLWPTLVILILIAIIALSSNGNKPTKEELDAKKKRRQELYEHFEQKEKESKTYAEEIPSKYIGIAHINFSVKGSIYRSKQEIAAARMCDVGDTIILRREADNLKDEFAVKVYTLDGYHIGYVEKQYSELAFTQIKYISKCTISKISFSDVPYIFVDVYFSEIEQNQPEFKNLDLQISPRNFMINPTHKFESKYNRIFALISWTSFLTPEGSKVLNNCSQGDELQLKRNPSSNIPFCVDVYKGDVFLGHVSGFDAIKVYKSINMPYKCIVSNPKSKLNVGVGIEVFYEGDPNSVEPTEDEKNTLKQFQREFFSEYEEASHLVHEEPQKALDLLLPLVDYERGLNIKHMCCRCYRKLKQYELEKEMVEKILHYIDIVPYDVAPEDVVLEIRASRDLYESRLAYDEKRIANKNKRK